MMMGLAGGVVATMDGWIGGHLSFGRGVGVAAHAFDDFPSDWTATTLRRKDLADGTPAGGSVGGQEIVVVPTAEGLFGLSGRCSFRSGSLREGEVHNGAIVCPHHGCMFRLRDGMVVRGPANVPQIPLDARLAEQNVEVRRAPSSN